jgi:hypothetical protein
VKPLDRIIVVLSLCALSASGCASSAPSVRDTGPPAPRFTAPPRIDHAAGWTGHYEGTGSAYTASAGDWQQNRPLELIIRSDRPNSLGIAGNPLSPDGWSFALEIEAIPSSVLTGESISADGALRYEYSFARADAHITGVIKRYQGEAPEGAFPSPDEWVFEVDRRPAATPSQP